MKTYRSQWIENIKTTDTFIPYHNYLSFLINHFSTLKNMTIKVLSEYKNNPINESNISHFKDLLLYAKIYYQLSLNELKKVKISLDGDNMLDVLRILKLENPQLSSDSLEYIKMISKSEEYQFLVSELLASIDQMQTAQFDVNTAISSNHFYFKGKTMSYSINTIMEGIKHNRNYYDREIKRLITLRNNIY